MKKYYASVREIDGQPMPVLVTDQLDGKWIPPRAVYLASDVDARIAELETALREALDHLGEHMPLTAAELKSVL